MEHEDCHKIINRDFPAISYIGPFEKTRPVGCLFSDVGRVEQPEFIDLIGGKESVEHGR